MADPTTHPDLAPLEDLVLTAVTLHAQRCSSTTTATTSAASTTSTTSAAAVHRAYAHFFAAMQDLTR